MRLFAIRETQFVNKLISTFYRQCSGEHVIRSIAVTSYLHLTLLAFRNQSGGIKQRCDPTVFPSFPSVCLSVCCVPRRRHSSKMATTELLMKLHIGSRVVENWRKRPRVVYRTIRSSYGRIYRFAANKTKSCNFCGV